MDAFSLYSPWIREAIYEKGWTDLRSVQKESAEALFFSSKDVLITSGTASGKTEAAMFPILTMLDGDPSSSVAVLYISPLKALINDQFSRMEELLEGRDFPVRSWHGDISRSSRRKTENEPKGMIEITPESLEMLLFSRKDTALRLFSDLRFIVIDEIHAFIGSDRGLQVISCIERLERLTGKRPRRIGLSATVSDTEGARRFLSSGRPENTVIAGEGGGKRKLRMKFDAVPYSADLDQLFIKKLYDAVRGRKCIVFSNSRSDTERTARRLREEAAARGERDVFLVHHGSLSREERSLSERLMKRSDSPMVICSTVTLELGIDIGDLDCIVQVDPPWSVSSFVQRLGRSGRRSGISELLFMERLIPSGDSISWGLIKMIAIAELYLKEGWMEPFSAREKPYSLLFHQTLSVLSSNTSMKARDLAREVLTLTPFKGRIGLDEYRVLLRSMKDGDIIEKMPDGELIIGTKGSDIVWDRSFSSVFMSTGDSIRVLSGSGEIGTIPFLPETGDVFILAGKSWKVTSRDPETGSCAVVQARDGEEVTWNGQTGETDRRIGEKMFSVLRSAERYSYLTEDAWNALVRSRMKAKEEGLLDNALISRGEGLWEFHPWTGSRELLTVTKILGHGLKTELKTAGVRMNGRSVTFMSGLPLPELLMRMIDARMDPSDIRSYGPGRDELRPGKYDRWIPEELLEEAYIRDIMKTDEALRLIRNAGTLMKMIEGGESDES